MQLRIKMIDWTVFIVLLIHQLYGFDASSACTVSRHLMATLLFFSSFISPDASLIRNPKIRNNLREVSVISDVWAINTTARVMGGHDHTICSRGWGPTQRSAAEAWHYISRRRFHPQPRSHGPRRGISRVSKALFTSNGMDMILALSAFNDLIFTEKEIK